MITQLYQTILYQPLFNLLIFFYNLIPWHDLGIAIVLLTVLLKLILYPLSQQTIRAQKQMQAIQPAMDELRRKYKDQKEKLGQEMIKLYKESKVNPFSSCLPILIQLPIFIAVYQVFRSGLNSESLNLLYSFIPNPGSLQSFAFGFLDLAKPNIGLAILAGLAQYWQTKMLMAKKPPAGAGAAGKDESMTAIMNKQMTYMMPLMTVVIGVTLPAGLTLYWFVFTLLTVLQQIYFFKKAI